MIALGENGSPCLFLHANATTKYRESPLYTALSGHFRLKRAADIGLSIFAQVTFVFAAMHKTLELVTGAW
jgi:hypothetical protein